MVSKDTFTAEVPKRFKEDGNFDRWKNKIDGSQILKIEAAKSKIENQGLVTNAKDLKDGLYEKKWNNGLRIYFAIVEDEVGKKTLLLLGSGKGAEQNKAIKKSREALRKYKVVKENIKYNSKN